MNTVVFVFIMVCLVSALGVFGIMAYGLVTETKEDREREKERREHSSAIDRCLLTLLSGVDARGKGKEASRDIGPN